MTMFAVTTWQDVAMSIVTLVLVPIVPYIIVRLEQQRTRGIETQKEVKQTLALSNGNMTDQKKLLVVSSETLAETTGKPEHIALAETAKKSLEEHLTAETNSETKTPVSSDAKAVVAAIEDLKPKG